MAARGSTGGSMMSKPKGDRHGVGRLPVAASVVMEIAEGSKSLAKIAQDAGVSCQYVDRVNVLFRDVIKGLRESEGLDLFRRHQLDLVDWLRSLCMERMVGVLMGEDVSLRELTSCYKELFSAGRTLEGKASSFSGEFKFTAPPELVSALVSARGGGVLDVGVGKGKESDGQE